MNLQLAVPSISCSWAWLGFLWFPADCVGYKQLYNIRQEGRTMSWETGRMRCWVPPKLFLILKAASASATPSQDTAEFDELWKRWCARFCLVVIWCTWTKRNFWLLRVVNSKIGDLELKPRFGSIPREIMELERAPYVRKLWPAKYQWETHGERTWCNSWPTARSKRLWWHQVFKCVLKNFCAQKIRVMPLVFIWNIQRLGFYHLW